jgi:dihydropyrimidinase
MGESCSQYLGLFEDKLQGTADNPFEGAKYVCSPPLRTPADADVLWASLANNTLQVVSTDHCPFFFAGGVDGRPPGKELGRDTFTRIPNGLPGIEDRLIVTWHWMRLAGYSLIAMGSSTQLCRWSRRATGSASRLPGRATPTRS